MGSAPCAPLAGEEEGESVRGDAPPSLLPPVPQPCSEDGMGRAGERV